jgi:ankyrin repeat protein
MAAARGERRCDRLYLAKSEVERYGWGWRLPKKPLHVLAEAAVCDALEQLCMEVRLVDVQDAIGNTPLAVAVLQGSAETVSLLLDFGAGKDVANAKGVRFLLRIGRFFWQ